MFRKVALFALAGVTAAGLFVGTADARATRVKGKFKVVHSGSPVLGSAKIRPMGGDVWLADLTLQHVRRTDYQLWVDVFADLNGNEAVDAGEQRGAVHFATCDLSRPDEEGSRRLPPGREHRRRQHAVRGPARAESERRRRATCRARSLI